MGLFDRFFARQKPEQRQTGGYTAEILAARSSYIAGRTGLGELTATVQTCVGLWEHAFTLADVEGGEDFVTRLDMGMLGRSLALRGNYVALVTDQGLRPVADWEVSTRDGIPRAYRLSISDAGGNRSLTALAAEVVHVRIGVDTVAPWIGTAPLNRAALTAGLMHTLETALAEIYGNAPLGSLIVPFPESTPDELERLSRTFRASRGKVIVRESVQVGAAGGPAPAQDWSPNGLTPDLSRSMTRENLESARAAILSAFGVLPGWFVPEAQGPLVREAQRHLAGWVLQPIGEVIAEEFSAKLGADVKVDIGRPLQAFDSGGRARALAQLVEAQGRAKELGLSPEEFAAALKAVNWGGGDSLA